MQHGALGVIPETDDTDASRVALINESAAARFFPDQDPIGHELGLWRSRRRIVGVVADERSHGLVVLVLTLVVLAFLAEGILSLLFGESWASLSRERTLLESLADRATQLDPDRLPAAAATSGPYRIHPDPWVGYTLRTSAPDIAGKAD